MLLGEDTDGGVVMYVLDVEVPVCWSLEFNWTPMNIFV